MVNNGRSLTQASSIYMKASVMQWDDRGRESMLKGRLLAVEFSWSQNKESRYQ